MPLIKSGSKKAISTNIREFHTGKTYAHTKAKFGKEKANKQAIAVALNAARRFSKRAEGGGVEDEKIPNPEFNPNQRKVYINPPPPQVPISDAPEGYQPEPAKPVRPSIMDYIQPGTDYREALHEQANEMPAALHEQGQENLRSGHLGKMLLGAGQEVLGAAMPAIAPIGAAVTAATKGIGRLAGPAAERMADVGSWLTPGAAGKSVLAGLGFTAAGVKNISKINDAVLKAVDVMPHGGEKEIFAALKQHYPKDVAQSAFYLGLGPEDVEKLKTFMLPGAQAAFDKHYLKMMKNPAAQKKVVQEQKAAAIQPSPPPSQKEMPPAFLQATQPPKAPNFGSNFGPEIDVADFTAIPNSQLGSNPGGKYAHYANGKQYYIKQGKADGAATAEERVRNELTASSLYDLAGAPTLKYFPVKGGKHVATQWEKLDKNNVYKFTPAERKEAQKDFVTHAWLGNYDAAGTGGDNLGILNGKPTILDNGGALEFRAQGKPKTNFGNEVTEIDSMRGLDPNVSAPDAKYVFGDMTEAELKASAKKVINIPDDKIRAVIKAHGGSDALAEKMIARKNDIAKRFGDKGGDDFPGDPGKQIQYANNSLPAGYSVIEPLPGFFAVTHKEAEKGYYYANSVTTSPTTSAIKFKENYPHLYQNIDYGAGPGGKKTIPINERDDWGPPPTHDEGYHYDPSDVIDAGREVYTPSQILSKMNEKFPYDEKVYGTKINLSHPGIKEKSLEKIEPWMNLGTIFKSMSKKSLDEAKLSPYGMTVSNINDILGKNENFLKKLASYNMTENELKNILSYLSPENLKQVTGPLFGKAPENMAPYKAFKNGYINKNEYIAKMREHFVPTDWQSFAPKDFDQSKLPQPQFSKGKEELKSLGFNPDVQLFKGGQWDSYEGGPFIPGGYPKEVMDPGLKHSEKAWHAASHPGIAQAYHKHIPEPMGGSYIARPQKFYEFDYKKFFGSPEYSYGDLDGVTREARKLGADMVAVHNMHDVGSHAHGLHTQFLVLNTEILRAPTAQFDPSKLHLRVPLAGIAGLGVGAGLYSYGSPAEASEHKKGGGKVKEKKHPQIDEDPQEHEFINFARGGLIDSDIPGRTDKIPMKVAPGAYVLPADIPSALGQGNTKAGHEILKKMFTHSAYGLPPPNIKSRPFSQPKLRMKADGGEVEEPEADNVPIVAAGGEYIIHPDVVSHLGGGSMKAGHKLLDKFVIHTRKQHIQTLRKLKPPK